MQDNDLHSEVRQRSHKGSDLENARWYTDVGGNLISAHFGN